MNSESPSTDSKETLRQSLRTKIFGKQFSRLPKDNRDVQSERARKIVEEQMTKMRESLNNNQNNK